MIRRTGHKPLCVGQRRWTEGLAPQPRTPKGTLHAWIRRDGCMTDGEREFSVSSDSQRLSHQLNTDTLTRLLYITNNSSISDIIWVHLIIVTSTLSLREKLNSCCIDSSWTGRIFLSSPPSCTRQIFSLHRAFITVKIYMLANVTMGAASSFCLHSL